MIRPVSDYVKSVSELANFIGIQSDLKFDFTGITSDSRSVASGDLFVALPGSNSHGAQYIDKVKASGAVAVITDEAGATLVGESCQPLLSLIHVGFWAIFVHGFMDRLPALCS